MLRRGALVGVVATLALLGFMLPANASGAANSVGFEVQPSSPQYVGVNLSAAPQVAYLDSSQNPVVLSGTLGVALENYPGLTSASSSLTCPAQSTTSGAVTLSNCSISSPGTYVLVTTNTSSLPNSTSSPFVVYAAPSKLAFTTQATASTGGVAFPTQPVVQLETSANAVVPVTGVSVSMTLVNSAGATLTCPSVSTVLGVASFANCSINLIGTYHLQASATTGIVVTGTGSSLAITLGPVSELIVTQNGQSIIAGSNFPTSIAVAVSDAGGNPETSGVDATDPIIVSTAGGATDPLSCTGGETPVGLPGYKVNAVAGVATFPNCTITSTTSSDSASLVAVVQTAANTNPPTYLHVDGSSFSVTPAAVASIAFTNQPSSSSQGATFQNQPSVALEDQYGNIESGISSGSVSLALSSGAKGTLTCSSQSISAGVANFSSCAVTAINSPIQLTASYVDPSSLTTYSATSSNFTIGAPQVSSLSFSTQAAGASAGSAFTTQPVVALSAGNGVSANGAVTLSVASGPGSLSCAPNSVSSVNGIATFTGCTLSLSGTYTLRASVTVNGNTISVTSLALSVSVGAPARLAISTPAVVAAGQAQSTPITVTVEDAAGETVTSASGSVSLSIRSGSGSAGALLTCSGGLSQSISVGVASFPACTISKSGSSYQLVAALSPAGLSGNSGSFNVSAGPAVALSFASVPSTVSQGAIWNVQPVVHVVDASGTTASSGVQVNLSATGATLHCSQTAVTAVGGVATFSGCFVSTMQSFTLSASAGGLAGVTSSSISVTPTSVVPSAPVGVPIAQTWGTGIWANSGSHLDDDVTSSTGQLDLQQTDLGVAALGPAFSLVRTYNSADTSSGVFGIGWSSAFDVSVAISGSSATVRAPDGQRLVFRGSGTGQWVGPPGSQVTLTCTVSGSVCQITTSTGVVYTVLGGRLASVLNAQGFGWHLMWSARGLNAVNLDTATGILSLAVTDNQGGQITSIVTPAGRSVSFNYNGGYLAGMVNTLGGSWTYAWSAGLLTNISSPDGNYLQVTWNADKVSSAQETNGSQRFDDTYSYGVNSTTRYAQVNTGSGIVGEPWIDSFANGVVVSTEAPSGGTWGYAWSSQLNEIGVVSPTGDQWVRTYSVAGDVTSSKLVPISGIAATTQYSWNTNHQMIGEISPTGVATSWQYSGFLLTAKTVSGLGTTLYSYNHYGELQSSSLGGTLTTYSHSPSGERAGLVVTVNGRSVDGFGPVWTYDEAGDVISATTADGHSPNGNNAAYTTTSSYDAAGDVLSVSSPSGTTTNNYSSSGRLLSTTVAGQTTSYVWSDSTGVEVVTAGSTVTTTTYDPMGDQTSVASNRVGLSSTMSYTPDGLVANATSSTGVVTTNTYDADDRLVARSDTLGDSATWQWNANNQVVSHVVNGVTTTSSFNAAGQVVGTSSPSGSVAFTYANNGLIASRSSALGVTTYSYDTLGDLVGESDSGGLSASFSYDGDGHVTASTVDGVTTTFAYDADGNLVSKTDPLGRVTTYRYTSSGALSSLTASGSGFQSSAESFTYNGAGALSSVTDAAGTRSFTYDASGNLTSSQQTSSNVALNGTFSYANSSAGNESETYPDGSLVSTSYGLGGNIAMVTDTTPGVSAPSALVAYQRATNGQEAAQMSGNGTLALFGDASVGHVNAVTLQCGANAELSYATSYTSGQLSAQSVYSPQGSPSRVNTSTSGPGNVYQDASNYGSVFTSYGPALSASPSCGSGAISASGTVSTNDSSDLATVNSQVSAPSWSAVPSPVAATTYTQSLQTTALGYTAAGDLSSVGGISTSSVSGHPSELSSVAGEQLHYDAAGEVTSIATSAGTRTFTYNAAGTLVQVTWTGGGAASVTANITSNYLGQVVAVSQTQGSTTTQTSYVYDPASAALAEEYVGMSESRRYVYGQGLAAIVVPGGQTYYVTNDAQGFPLAESNNLGNIVDVQLQGTGFQGSQVFGSQNLALPSTWLHGLFSLPGSGLIFTSQGPADITTGRLLSPTLISASPNSPLTSPYRSASASQGARDVLAVQAQDSTGQANTAFAAFTPTSEVLVPSVTLPESNSVQEGGGFSPQIPTGPSRSTLLEGQTPAFGALPLGQVDGLSVLARSSLSALNYGTLLANVYKLQYDDVVRQMVAEGYNLDGISLVLNKVFHFTPTALSEYLNDTQPSPNPYSESGFTSTPNEIATAIQNTYPSS